MQPAKALNGTQTPSQWSWCQPSMDDGRWQMATSGGCLSPTRSDLKRDRSGRSAVPALTQSVVRSHRPAAALVPYLHPDDVHTRSTESVLFSSHVCRLPSSPSPLRVYTPSHSSHPIGHGSSPCGDRDPHPMAFLRRRIPPDTLSLVPPEMMLLPPLMFESGYRTTRRLHQPLFYSVPFNRGPPGSLSGS